jgi:hypothetical protein
VKEKLDVEMAEVVRRREEMKKMEIDIARQKQQESQSLAEILERDRIEKEQEFQSRQREDEKKIKQNKLLEELEVMRKIRATEVV